MSCYDNLCPCCGGIECSKPDLKPCYCGNFGDDGADDQCTRECEHEENEDE